MCRRIDRGGMSMSRTNCIDCGFDVAARAECPLCGHTLPTGEGTTTALRTLFRD